MKQASDCAFLLLVWLSLALWAGVEPISAAESFRFWKSAAGSTVEARILRSTDGVEGFDREVVVTIETRGGRKIEVRYDQLSRGDQVWLRNWRALNPRKPPPTIVPEVTQVLRRPAEGDLNFEVKMQARALRGREMVHPYPDSLAGISF